MGDITGNPTPLNVASPQNASGTLTPKTAPAATPAPGQPTPTSVPVGIRGAHSLPSTMNGPLPPPAVPDMPYGQPAVVLLNIVVTPANATVHSGNSLQFTATGNYSSGPSKDLTTSVAWTSSNTSIANFSPDGAGGGLVTGSGGGGDLTVTATLGNIQGSTGLTVNAS